MDGNDILTFYLCFYLLLSCKQIKMCVPKTSVKEFIFFWFFHYANLTITGNNLNNTNK